MRFAFQTTQKLYMIFDYFNGGELFHYLSKGGKFGEERSRLYAAEIALVSGFGGGKCVEVGYDLCWWLGFRAHPFVEHNIPRFEAGELVAGRGWAYSDH